MIIAWRVPLYTEQVRAATIRAAEPYGHRAAGSPRVTEAGPPPERRLVEQLEQLGYRVTLERIAA